MRQLVKFERSIHNITIRLSKLQTDAKWKTYGFLIEVFNNDNLLEKHQYNDEAAATDNFIFISILSSYQMLLKKFANFLEKLN